MNVVILIPRGNSLTFGTGVLLSSNFLRHPNNQLSSFENKLDNKKMDWTMTYKKYQSSNNLAYSKCSTSGPQNFRTQIILPIPNCRPQLSTLAPPFQRVKELPRNITLRWPGGWMPPPTEFSNFFSRMGRAFLQTKFLAVGSSLGHLCMKKVFGSDLPSWP